jgi:hypothetical protein
MVRADEIKIGDRVKTRDGWFTVDRMRAVRGDYVLFCGVGRETVEILLSDVLYRYVETPLPAEGSPAAAALEGDGPYVETDPAILAAHDQSVRELDERDREAARRDALEQRRLDGALEAVDLARRRVCDLAHELVVVVGGGLDVTKTGVWCDLVTACKAHTAAGHRYLALVGERD